MTDKNEENDEPEFDMFNKEYQMSRGDGQFQNLSKGSKYLYIPEVTCWHRCLTRVVKHLIHIFIGIFFVSILVMMLLIAER